MHVTTATGLIRLLQDYFLGSRDRESQAWVMRADQPSSFLRSSAHFGDKDFGIHIIDQFAGLQPILINLESLTNEIQIPFRPSVFLDSNVVNYVHQFVRSRSPLNAKRRQIINDCLRFIIAHKLDLNAFFYYMEGAAKNDEAQLMQYAVEISKSILTIHTMDDQVFLQSGAIIEDPTKLSRYAEEYDAPTLEEIAVRYARQMVCPTDPHIDGMSKLVYVTLLKMGLIHKSSRRNVAAKYEELRLFMENTLDIAMGAERILALGYFGDLFDDFIPLQKGANSDRFFNRLRATAWDMLLLKLPAKMLVTKDNEEVIVGYICTADQTLMRVAQGCFIEAVIGFNPSQRQPTPLMSYDLSSLRRDLGAKVINDITKRDASWQKDRTPRMAEPGERISYERLLAVIAELEDEAVHFCGG